MTDLLGKAPSDELVELWSLTDGGYVCNDLEYGQTGLDIFSPEQSARAMASERYKEERWVGHDDIVLGEFVGDGDYILVDGLNGTVRPSLTGYERGEWPAFTSIFDFISCYYLADGNKFWD